MPTTTPNPRRPGRQPVLTHQIVDACRRQLAAGTASIAALAREYGVHPTTMRMACKGITWSEHHPETIEPPATMRRIPGYTAYFADEQGEVYSIRQSDRLHRLTPGHSGKGLKVFLIPDAADRGHTAQVHDLVCAAWHGARPTPEHRVRHADGDRRNNVPANLSWALLDSINYTRGGAVGAAHGRAKLTDADVLEILAYSAIGARPADIARYKGIHPTTVAGIIQRRLWRHVDIPATGLPTVVPLPTVTRTPPAGAQHGRAKLDDDKVVAIRTSTGRKTNVELATVFKVHPTTIARIRSGQGWRCS